MLGVILECFAFVFFILAAFGMEQIGRAKLVALGLAFWVLAQIIGGVHLPFLR